MFISNTNFMDGMFTFTGAYARRATRCERCPLFFCGRRVRAHWTGRCATTAGRLRCHLPTAIFNAHYRPVHLTSSATARRLPGAGGAWRLCLPALYGGILTCRYVGGDSESTCARAFYTTPLYTALAKTFCNIPGWHHSLTFCLPTGTIPLPRRAAPRLTHACTGSGPVPVAAFRQLRRARSAIHAACTGASPRRGRHSPSGRRPPRHVCWTELLGSCTAAALT